MKRILTILGAGLLLAGCSLGPQKAGLEINSEPTATVVINGQEEGSTPYKNITLKPGDVDVKLTTGEVIWEKSIHLENGTNTVIDRKLAADNNQDGGYILYLEATGDKGKAGLLVNAKPDKAAVAVDNEIKGYTPIRLDDIGEGDKQITISYPSFESTNVYVRGIKGYQLVIEDELAQSTESLTPTPIPTTEEASPAAQLAKIKILQTGTGWLRVRQSPDSNGKEIKRVNTGDTYSLINQEGDWDLIDLGNGTSGWISTKYAEKLGG